MARGRIYERTINKNKRPDLLFYGQNKEFAEYDGEECLLSGPAGTGKSVCSLAKLHAICESKSFPGSRCLIIRKTRESLTESALVTFEDKIIPWDHPAVRKGGQRKMRQSYRYENGSEIIVGGMDKPSKIMSTEYDVIYVQEATELREEDWEALTTRLRNNKWPIQQIMGDCNPEAPTHWLKKRCDIGKTKMFYSRHKDNPAYCNQSTGEWTIDGTAYLKKLESSLSGSRYLRLFKGEWVSSDGIVYPEFDSSIHIVDKFPPPPTWRRIWSVDFGFNAPMSIQFWAVDEDDRMFLYREIYHSKRLVEDHAREALRVWREEAEYWSRIRRVTIDSMQKQIAPEAIVCDHDREDRTTLERHLGLSTLGARKLVKRGLQAVSERFRQSGDGKPRLYLMRDALVERDKELWAVSLPCCLAEEIPGYVMDQAKDEPVKKNDHGCDAMRYAVMYVTGGLYSTWEPTTPIKTDKARDITDVFHGHEENDRWRYGKVRQRRAGGKLFGGGR